METKIISQKSNPFLEREEFVMEIISDITPTDAQIKEELGKDDNLTVIRKATTRFGSKKVIADIIVYNNEAAKKKNQVLPQKLRKKLEAEQKAREEEERKAKAEAEKAVEEEAAKPEEATTEEKKEEEETEADAPKGVPPAQMASADADKVGKEEKVEEPAKEKKEESGGK